MTRNEILTSLNKPRDWVLALVEVDGGSTEVRYLPEPFIGPEDVYFPMTSVNYPWRDFFERGSPPAPSPRPPVEHWITVMVDRLAAGFSPDRIVLFGSYARGDADEDSDVDLLVVMPEDDERREVEIEMRRLVSDLPVAKDIVVTTNDEIRRRGHVIGTVLEPALREGKVVYARS